MPNCTADIHFRDLDGSAESMPCSYPASRRITTRTPWLREAIASEGGWSAHRARCAAAGEDDPGDDPGEVKWGDDTELLCDAHAAECVAGADVESPYFYEVLSDEPLYADEAERVRAEHEHARTWEEMSAEERFAEDQEEERRISRSD